MTDAQPRTGVNWTAFYARLESLHVQIPDTAPGEPVDLLGLQNLFAKCQRSRDEADRILRYVLARMGNTKKRLDAKQYELRMERAQLYDDARLVPASLGEGAKRGRVDYLSANTSGQVATLKGRMSELEMAYKAVNATLQSLENAKQTLNSIKAIALADVSPRASYTRDPRRSP